MKGRRRTLCGHLKDASDTPDAAWMAGMLRLKWGELTRAEQHLSRALTGGAELGRRSSNPSISPRIANPHLRYVANDVVKAVT
jgi:hypothetical protein